MNNISMHILDIVQNSIRGKASFIEIFIHEQTKQNRFELHINDNGKGMDGKMLAHVTDPYTTTRTTRKVGLGLPLLKHSAEQANGELKVESEKGKGTSVSAIFQLDHMDKPPIGDLAGTIVLIVAANPHIDFKYTHNVNEKCYEFDTREVKEILGEVEISNPKIRNKIKELIKENVKDLYLI